MVKKRGIVWNYFTNKVHGSQIIAFCKFCNQSYIQNATRMEKHIERCVKCPENVKQDFLALLRHKRAKSLITMNLAESWSSMQQSHLQIQNNTLNQAFENLSEWNCKNQPNNIDNEDSKAWNNTTQIEGENLELNTTDLNLDSEKKSSDVEANNTDQEEDTADQPPQMRKIHPNKRFSQLPLLSGRTSVNSILQNKIQHEQYLERRALRRIAELELQRKTLELEKYQQELQIEKSQNEMRWAHECHMMQMKEELQRQLIENNCTGVISMQPREM